MTQLVSKPVATKSLTLSWKQKRLEKRLVYTYTRCPCGALYAYDPKTVSKGDIDDRKGSNGAYKAWDCSDIILGMATPKDEPGSKKHDDVYPFIFWNLKKADHNWALQNRVNDLQPSDSEPIQGYSKAQ